MNIFAGSLNDEVYIEAPDGKRQGPFKTAIGKGEAAIFDETIDVEEGYKLVKPLPNGKAEIYTIIEAKHNNNFYAIPAHYALKVRKDSSLVAPNAVNIDRRQTINISSSSEFQIGDGNRQVIYQGIAGLIDHIENSSSTPAEKAEAKSRLRKFLEHPIVSTITGKAIDLLLPKP
jgi:hypothetical protein